MAGTGYAILLPLSALLALGAFLVAWRPEAVLRLLGAALWPDVPGWWTWGNLWGLRFGAFPLEEMAWAFLYTGAWSASLAWMPDARLEPRRDRRRAASRRAGRPGSRGVPTGPGAGPAG